MAEKVGGIKSFRFSGAKNQNNVKPEYQCENCKCKRYTKCGCMRKGEKNV